MSSQLSVDRAGVRSSRGLVDQLVEQRGELRSLPGVGGQRRRQGIGDRPPGCPPRRRPGGCRRARRARLGAGRRTRPGGPPARCPRCRRRRAGASTPKRRWPLLRHRHPEQDPVESRLPCVGLDAVELERACGAPASNPQRTNAPSTHSSRRKRSSSLKSKRRRTGSRPARSRTSVAVIRAVASSSTSASTPITGLVWRSERSASRISSVRVRVVGPSSRSCAAERRLDERGEVLDVGAHDDDVAWLESRIVRQQVQDGVAQHLDLAPAAVAGVDPDAVVVRRRAAAARPRPPPCPRARGRRGRRPGSAAGGSATSIAGARPRPLAVRNAPPSTSCISRASRPQDASSGLRGALAVGSSRPEHERATSARPSGCQPVPQRGRRVQQEEVDVAACADRLQHVEVARRQPGQPEQRQPRRQVQELGLIPQPAAGARPGAPPDPAARSAPAAAATAPPARPPRPSCGEPGGPALQHVGAVDGVAVEEVGDVADAREALRALARSRSCAMCWASGASHGSSKCSSTTSSSGQTARSGARDRRRGRCPTPGQRPVDQRPGEREVDVGAHAVLPAGRSLRVAPTGAASASARCRWSGPRPPRASSGLERLRDQVTQHRHQAHRPARSGGRAAPRQSTSRCSRWTARSASLQLGAAARRYAEVPGAGAALGQRQDVRLPGFVLVVVGLDRLQMAGRRLDRRQLGDLRPTRRPPRRDPGTCGPRPARVTRSEPTALL